MNETAKNKSDLAFHYLVGGLLVIIIALLAWLWQRERTARQLVERQYQRDMEQVQAAMHSQQQSLGAMLMAAQQASAVSRDDLPSRAVTIDGQQATAFTVSASAGERMGFEPGDVVIVAQPAASPTPTATSPAP